MSRSDLDLAHVGILCSFFACTLIQKGKATKEDAEPQDGKNPGLWIARGTRL